MHAYVFYMSYKIDVLFSKVFPQHRYHGGHLIAVNSPIPP